MNIAELRQQILEHPEIQQCRESPFSRTFLRGHSRLEIRTLDTMAYKWPGNSQSLVELIVNYLLTENERAEVFPSPYDMGNRQPLNPKSTRRARVMEHLQLLVPNRDPKKLLQLIKDDIKLWTGHEFEAFAEVDEVIATKMLCGLYEFRAWIRPTLPSLLVSPNTEFSSEFRSTWPFSADGRSSSKAVEIVQVVADLKAMMTFQMGPDQDDLRQVLLLLQHQFDSRSFPHPIALSKGRRAVVSDTLVKLQEMLPTGAGVTPHRLDIALYVHLTVLEIEHKLHATDALVEFLKNDSTISVMNSFDLGDQWLYCEDDCSDKTFFGLLLDITGISVEQQQWQFYWHCSTLVLSMRFQEASEIAIIERFAALVSVVGSPLQELDYAIWWKGYTSTSQRPWYYLKKAVQALHETDVIGAIDTIPYGYREFWAQRYSLILHRGMEAEEMWDNCNTCASEEVRMVIAMLRTTDIEEAVRRAILYIDEKYRNSLEQTGRILGPT